MNSTNMKNLKQFGKRLGNWGFSIIELMVVMALIGVTASVATVYVSRNQTELKTFSMNFRFDLERAKKEAANRNRLVRIVLDEGLYDCDMNGVVDEADNCYFLLCRNCETTDYGEMEYNSEFYDILDIKMLSTKYSIHFDTNKDQIAFEPGGASKLVSGSLATYMNVDESSSCTDGCMEVAHPISISQTGNIVIEPSEKTCVGTSYCS